MTPTVGMNEAFQRLRSIDAKEEKDREADKNERWRPEDWTNIVSVRNGSVHAGVSAEDSRQHVVTCLNLLERLAKRIDLPPDQLYGDCGHIAGMVRTEYQTEGEKAVKTKIAKVRTAYLSAVGTMTEDDHIRVIEDAANVTRGSLVARRSSSGETAYARQACPSCQSKGFVCGFPEVILEDVEEDYELDSDGPNHYLVPTYTRFVLPNSFACALCRLTLDGRDQLQWAGIAVTLRPGTHLPPEIYEADPIDY